MSTFFELLGMVGIGISVVAYVPQVAHLARERCSNGISVRTWELWLLSSLFIGALATYQRNYVFVALAVTNLVSALIILSMARRYQGMACSTHNHLAYVIQSEHNDPAKQGTETADRLGVSSSGQSLTPLADVNRR